MDDDLRVLADFFGRDEYMKKKLEVNFYQWGEITFDEITTEIVRLFGRKLGLSEIQMDELRYDKRRIREKLTERFLSCGEEFVAEFNGIKTSPEELTKGTLAVSDETYDEAMLYCRKVRGKLDELNSPDITRSSSGSSFSKFTQNGTQFLRDYVEDSFGSQAVRRFDYYCESDVREKLDIGAKMALSNICYKSSDDVDELQGCVRKMNVEKAPRARVEALL